MAAEKTLNFFSTNHFFARSEISITYVTKMTYDQVAKLFVHNFPEIFWGSNVAIIAAIRFGHFFNHVVAQIQTHADNGGKNRIVRILFDEFLELFAIVSADLHVRQKDDSVRQTRAFFCVFEHPCRHCDSCQSAKLVTHVIGYVTGKYLVRCRCLLQHASFW